MRTACLRRDGGTFYTGSFGDMRNIDGRYFVSILPRPCTFLTSFDGEPFFEAKIKPLCKVVEYDEYLIVQAPTMLELVDKLSAVHAIEIEFEDPTPELAEMLKRPKAEQEPARFDGVLEPPVEQLKGWQRKAHENAKKRASKNQIAQKADQLDMFGELA